MSDLNLATHPPAPPPKHEHQHRAAAISLPQSNTTPKVREALSPWTIAGFIFLAGAVGALLWIRGSEAGSAMGLSFVSIILEALPFVMLGSLLGGIVEVFVSREWVIRLIPKRKVLAILFAAGLGLLLPVCECAVVPFTRRLVKKGMPFSTAVAYLLAGPIVNLLVGSATLMAYGWNWHVLWARMGFGYAVAVTVALLMDRFFPGHLALSDPDMAGVTTCSHGCDHDHSHDHSHDHPHDHGHWHHHEPGHSHDHAHAHEHTHEHAPVPLTRRLIDAINHAGDDFIAVGQFLVIGAFVASICQTVIPRQSFMTMAHAPALAIATLMGLAVVLNLCSGADAFVAASFRNALPLSAQMGFMVLGPMLDLKLSAMYLSFIRKRAFFTLVVLMYSIVFALMVGWHYLFVSGSH